MTRKQERALQAHWRRETEMFSLRPWQMPPVLAEAPPAAGDRTPWARSYALARQRREAFLREDPDHYADVDA